MVNMSDHITKNSIHLLMANIKELLVGETINDIKFPEWEKGGYQLPMKICTLSGKVIIIGVGTEFDNCGDYDETRLYVEVHNEGGGILLDDYLS